MPFQSQKQRSFLHAKHPKIAKRWENEEKGKTRGKKVAELRKRQGKGAVKCQSCGYKAKAGEKKCPKCKAPLKATGKSKRSKDQKDAFTQDVRGGNPFA